MCDLGRSSCSIPDELSLGELQNILLQNAEIKRRRTAFCKQNALEMEVSTVDPLATAATLGDVANQASASVAVTTTKHPRHRPGCTCIVCIQPPSGKGPKHNPTCTCNVCMTVKRRFKTLMLRKKKRQSEREETETHKRLLPDWGNKDDKEGSSSSFNGLQGLDSQKEIDIGTEFGIATIEKLELEKAHIDLNYQPEHGVQQKADGSASSSRMSMMSLLHVANLPLENYLKQNGLTSLVSEQHVSSSSVTVPQTIAADDSEGRTPEGKTPAEGLFGATQDLERGGEEGYCSRDKPKSDA
ncbi:putative pentatricopeptide repeat-containing protein [Iris pallida]|uniref:Pentatricopeptide repeat-containing protein n=1 Tax=Iris pallida TaxID=29817 RepID=A0AAX6FJV0_IRIPA|nr:putative pentatricopeptide repeat-containing protein [Iris pallida]